jgi:hypothetical protein
MAAPASWELFIVGTDGKPAIVMTNGFAESRRALEGSASMSSLLEIQPPAPATHR